MDPKAFPTLRFGVLGPLEVVQAGRTRTPTAPRLRTLLALLVVRANRVVSYDELIEELWGARPPANPTNALQVFVRRLRRVLAQRPDNSHPPPEQLLDAGERHAPEQRARERVVPERRTREQQEQVFPPLRTCPGGYLLEAAPELLDVSRFETLVNHGRYAASRGDPAAATEALRSALAVWRGPVLADVRPGVSLQARSVALEEARLVALEERIEAELRMARHRELVSELRTLTTQHPLREGFWRQLMVAQFRSGRRAEALASYQKLRTALVRELGMEPGDELSGLQQAILTDDSSLQRPTGVGPWVEVGQLEPSQVTLAVPPISQLPSDVADFVGRATPLAQLAEGLPDRTGGHRFATPIVTISGSAGTGKTALAVRAAHSCDAYPDGQLYADLQGTRGATPAADVLGRFLRALGHDDALPDPVEERAEVFRSRLTGRRFLVLLDDAADERQVRPLLPADPHCGVLVTSRRRLILEGATAIDLPLFEPGEAIELLGRLAGGSRVAAEPRAAERVIQLCGLLPLAVRVAGAKLATRPHWALADLAKRLADKRNRLGELRVGDLDVRASFALSYHACDPAERRAFRLLAGTPGPHFPARMVAAACDTDVQTAASIAERLVEARLLEVAGRDVTGRLRYRFHDLLRVYAAERLDIEEAYAARRGAIERIRGAYRSWE